jgi:hypothetical protein
VGSVSRPIAYLLEVAQVANSLATWNGRGAVAGTRFGHSRRGTEMASRVLKSGDYLNRSRGPPAAT